MEGGTHLPVHLSYNLSMNDWAKVLLGTIAGFLFGLLAEPIKFWMSNRLKQGQARKVLYSEFSRVLVVLEELTEQADCDRCDDEQEKASKASIERLRSPS